MYVLRAKVINKVEEEKGWYEICRGNKPCPEQILREKRLSKNARLSIYNTIYSDQHYYFDMKMGFEQDCIGVTKKTEI